MCLAGASARRRVAVLVYRSLYHTFSWRFQVFRVIFHWLLRTSPVSEEIRVYEYVYEYGSIRKSYSHSFHPRAPRSASGGIGDSESASMNRESGPPLVLLHLLVHAYRFNLQLFTQ